MKNTTPTAAELAANFQVAELEPRLENAWLEGVGGGGGCDAGSGCHA